ncbi:MAG: DUF4358 domain-containing protein [Ruminococcus sp.]|nr:DUF4358 domain-containing protein [Ruminococcus sp.]MBQ4105934.1 DUF4358 domain-containing protein [Clostridia bacterium]
MKRIFSIVLAALCLLSLAACTDSATKDIDIAAVKEQIITDLAIEGAMDVESDRLLNLYGIAAEDVAESACFVTIEGVFPDEIVMVKATDADAAKRVAESLNTRLDEVKVQSQSYDPENYAIAQECQVLTEGNVVALFLSPKHAEMEEIFSSAE